MIFDKNFKNTHYVWNQSFILFSVFLFLVSCDSVHTFSVQNKSDRGKYLEVIGILNDSILIQELEMSGKVEQIKLIPSLSKNEEKRSFSFYLPPQNKANIEFGWGLRPITKQVIVNKTDTIIIRKSKGRVKRQPFLKPNYVLILKD